MFSKNQGVKISIPENPSYTETELRELMNQCDEDNETDALLSALNRFLNESTQESYFKRLRDSSKSDQDLLTTLNNMAAAIEEFKNPKQSSSNTKASGKPNPQKEAIISYAIGYVKDQLEQLSQNKDRIYDVYKRGSNQSLAKVLQSHTLPTRPVKR